MKRLQNKVAVITGGGSGIGAATAALFVQEGARVVVVGRNEEKLRKTPYVASKHAVVGIARAAAIDGAPHRIRVNAGRVPLKRFASNEEVARVNLFLASDDSSYCTGGAYTVDGGWSSSLP